MAVISCRGRLKLSLKSIMCKVAEGGEPQYEVYRAVHNSFIDTLSNLANTILAAIKPILEIDKVVVDTFVKPPLEATIAVLDQTTKTIKLPMRVIGGLVAPECGSWFKGVNTGMNAACDWLSKDHLKLKNTLDNIEDWTSYQADVVDALESLVDNISELRLDLPYDEFIATCQEGS